MKWPKPLTPVVDAVDADTLKSLNQFVGSVGLVALIAAVLGIAIGAMLIGAGIWGHRPDLASKGWHTVVGCVLAAVLIAGLGAWVGWWGNSIVHALTGGWSNPGWNRGR